MWLQCSNAHYIIYVYTVVKLQTMCNNEHIFTITLHKLYCIRTNVNNRTQVLRFSSLIYKIISFINICNFQFFQHIYFYFPPSSSTITLHHHVPPSHSTISFHHTAPSRSTITRHHHVPPSHCTITFHHHTAPSRSTITFHHHMALSRSTITPHHR